MTVLARIRVAVWIVVAAACGAPSQLQTTFELYVVSPAHMRHIIGLVGKPLEIAPYLAESFEFREIHPPRPSQTKPEFLAGMVQMTIDYTEMSLVVDSILTHRPDSLEARGRFSALYKAQTRFDLHFAITMRFDASGRVASWSDHFRQEPF